MLCVRTSKYARLKKGRYIILQRISTGRSISINLEAKKGLMKYTFITNFVLICKQIKSISFVFILLTQSMMYTQILLHLILAWLYTLPPIPVFSLLNTAVVGGDP